MYFITDQKIHEAIEEFENLDPSRPEVGDKFFEKYGPGNAFVTSERPFERFSDYEELLIRLQLANPTKYIELHKGTPYYFLAWTAFDLKNYQKALFYMDAAISEDVRKDPVGWISNPAGGLITLSMPNIQAAARVYRILDNSLTEQFNRFSQVPHGLSLSREDFVKKFIHRLTSNTENRSIITAFYTYIVEFTDRYQELKLRSIAGGSIEPILTHLFKGGLIFESLLKYLYGNSGKTIGQIVKSNSFQVDFFGQINVSASNFNDIISAVIPHDIKSSFDVTSQLRNTTGHNLVWQDVFNDPENYKLFVEQQINAILFIVAKKFCTIP